MREGEGTRLGSPSCSAPRAPLEEGEEFRGSFPRALFLCPKIMSGFFSASSALSAVKCWSDLGRFFHLSVAAIGGLDEELGLFHAMVGGVF